MGIRKWDADRKRGRIKRICPICGKQFRTNKSSLAGGRGKVCGIKCRPEYIKKTVKRMEQSPVWKGGRMKNPDGYIRIYLPKHHRAGKRGDVMEHWLVVEKNIGRYLKKKEVVHHINGVKDDNRIENLMLFPNTGEHTKFHHKLRIK